MKKPSSASDGEDGEITGCRRVGGVQGANSTEKVNNKRGRNQLVQDLGHSSNAELYRHEIL
jgi:hypothetical protein